MNEKLIATIIKLGTVVMATIISFAFTPPVIDVDENNGISWKNVFVFVAGVLSLFFYNRFKGSLSKKNRLILITGLLILLSVAYEIAFVKYSVKCYSDTRCIISYEPAKSKAIANNQAYWETHCSFEKKSRCLLEAYNCSSTTIWNYSDIAIPYYGLILLYFGIIICTILLIVSVSDMIIIKEEKINTNNEILN